MDAKKEINWQIAWYHGLDVLLLKTQKDSFSVFVRLKIHKQHSDVETEDV